MSVESQRLKGRFTVTTARSVQRRRFMSSVLMRASSAFCYQGAYAAYGPQRARYKTCHTAVSFAHWIRRMMIGWKRSRLPTFHEVASTVDATNCRSIYQKSACFFSDKKAHDQKLARVRAVIQGTLWAAAVCTKPLFDSNSTLMF